MGVLDQLVVNSMEKRFCNHIAPVTAFTTHTEEIATSLQHDAEIFACILYIPIIVDGTLMAACAV